MAEPNRYEPFMHVDLKLGMEKLDLFLEELGAFAHCSLITDVWTFEGREWDKFARFTRDESE